MANNTKQSTEFYVEQLRRVVSAMGWRITKIEVLEGDVIQVQLVHRPEGAS